MAQIIPAILTNDVSDFHKKYAELFALSHYFKKLHIDFIDGEFLPQKTLMPGDECRIKGTIKLSAHLMTFKPQNYFAILKNCGYSEVLIHFEAFEDKNDIYKAIDLAKILDLNLGLVLNPETELHSAAKFIQKFNLIQLMGIHPGAQGRTFDPHALDRIRELKKLKKDVIISIDGGIKPGIAGECVRAGAEDIVAGSYVVKSHDYKHALEQLTEDIETK